MTFREKHSPENHCNTNSKAFTTSGPLGMWDNKVSHWLMGQFELSSEVTQSQKPPIWCGLFCTCIRPLIEFITINVTAPALITKLRAEGVAVLVVRARHLQIAWNGLQENKSLGRQWTWFDVFGTQHARSGGPSPHYYLVGDQTGASGLTPD